MRIDTSNSVLLGSSVVIKWFRRYEILYEQAIRLRQLYLDGNLLIVVPDILIYEIANVLRYKSDMDPSKVQQAMQSLYDMGIEIQYVGLDTIEKAVTIAYSYDVTVYDAVFVAFAEILEIDFITVDEKLMQKLSNFPNIYHLADWFIRI